MSWLQHELLRHHLGLIDLMLEHPAMIKRPLLDTGSTLHVGFSESQYQELFQRHTL